MSARLEIRSKRKPLTEAHALFYKGPKEVVGNEANINLVCGKIQSSIFVKMK